MSKEPMLNGLPLADARRMEARGGAGRRDDPFARMPRARPHAATARGNGMAAPVGTKSNLTQSGQRADMSSIVRGETVAARPAISMPSGGAVADRLRAGLFWYRDKVRALLRSLPFGFSHIGIAAPILVLGATVWLPITIISALLVGLAGLLHLQSLALIGSGLLTIVMVLACGYFLLDRIANRSDDL